MKDQYLTFSDSGLFAAANSGRGFCSFFGEIFSAERTEHRYLIKGGPGTGKSSFMRKVADEARRRGMQVDHYKCSSDPASLDAILIDSRVALIDSTAPHALEPDMVGARDEIVDIGVFWNSALLREKSDAIRELGREKSARYKAAYRYLEAALALDLRSREIIKPHVKNEKLRRAAERLAAAVPMGDGYKYRTGICTCVSMNGRQRLDFYEKTVKKIYAVCDCMSLGAEFIAAVADEAVKRRTAIVVSYDPINLTSPDALLFEESGVAFRVCKSEDTELFGAKLAGVVNTKRFLLRWQNSALGRADRSEYRFARRTREAMIDSACEQLSLAGEAHFSLEKIYGESMDFDALGRFCESFATMICDNLQK